MKSRSRDTRLLSLLFVVAIVIGACGQAELVDPGPTETESTTSSTTTTDAPDEEPADGESTEDADGEVVTDGATTTTVANVSPIGPGENNAIADAPTEFVVSDETENGDVFIELADSGLALSVDEQTCVDDTSRAAIEGGASELEGVIAAVQECATPAAMDDFASTLIVAGGQPLPPTEAACVSSLLRDTDAYRPFWSTLLEAEQFDFLLAESDVQNRYLDLYAECVSVGRAVAEQTNAPLSIPTMGCIDELYADREFVRITIEADLSGNVEDLARIDGQLSGCMTADEIELIYGG